MNHDKEIKKLIYFFFERNKIPFAGGKKGGKIRNDIHTIESFLFYDLTENRNYSIKSLLQVHTADNRIQL